MNMIGQVIDDKYQILALIGKGGMSEVYLARDKRLNKQWAVKMVPKHAKDKANEVVVQSAIAEANLIKKLDHPNIVRIVDIIENPDVIYIIEDYVEGEPLDKILEQYGAQSQDMVIEWAMQICDAFEYLHTNNPPVIYRDMKPANIMLKPDGNIKIIDFGIAREYKDHSLADTVNLGTKGYAAPEQFGGKGQTDPRTDIYCLGVTIHHLVTGHNPADPPYEILPIRYYNALLDPGLEAVIEKCTQLNPDDRYQSCAELLYALQHYQENGSAYREKQKRKLIAFVATASACVLCALFGLFGLGMRVYTNNADYTQNVLQAERTSDSSEKATYYAKAIDIRPLTKDAYIGMIEAFKDDAAFTTEEEKKFKEKINPNISMLRDQPFYGDLSYEIGKLYWYYYDYGKTEKGDNQITRMKSAIQWFKDAAEYGGTSSGYYTTAKVYQEIGEFNRDINLNIEEASDQGLYAPYWKNIQGLVQNELSKNDSEIVQLEICRLAVYSIETYSRKFKNDGISQESLQDLLDSVNIQLESINATSDKTMDIKEDVTSRLPDAASAIVNAYRK